MNTHFQECLQRGIPLSLLLAACFSPPGISSNPGETSTAGSSAGSTSGGGTGGGSSSGSTGSVVGDGPAVMLVVDRSGSMTEAATGSGPGCTDSSGNYATDRTLDCKWNNLLAVLLGRNGAPGFLAGLQQRFPSAPSLGLMTFSNASVGDFSTDASCSAGVVRVPLAANTTVSIAVELDRDVPAGATPTATSLKALATSNAFSAVAGHAAYVVLLTDGAPNCNENIVANADDCGGDRCTLSPTGCTAWDATCECWNYALGCLDEDPAVSAVAALAHVGVKTFVVGIGTDIYRGSSVDTLNRMAQAGGEALVDGSGQPRAISYYVATSQTDLQNALSDITGVIVAGH